MGRIIKIKKDELIRKLEENKLAHIEDYKLAVINYKKEVYEQLENLKKLNDEGSLDIHLNLVRPEDNTEFYDKAISMFTWELNDEVVLSQHEFDEFIMDENRGTEMARLSNSTYFNKFGG